MSVATNMPQLDLMANIKESENIKVLVDETSEMKKK